MTGVPTRDEAKRGERGRHGDFPLRKAAHTVRRSAGSWPNALSLLSGALLEVPSCPSAPTPSSSGTG